MNIDLLKQYQDQVNYNSNETFSFYDVYEVSMSGGSSSSSCCSCCCCLLIAYAASEGGC